jgi:hypothetical protein
MRSYCASRPPTPFLLVLLGVLFSSCFGPIIEVRARADSGTSQDCPPNATWCGNACADLNSDSMHCGACGTGCSTTQRCAAGQCVSRCEAGAICQLPGEPCRVARIECVSGSEQCVAQTNAPAGTGCGTGKVCDAQGQCFSCEQDSFCASPVCTVGAISCQSGTPVCQLSPAPRGTVCAGGVCGVDAGCAPCVNDSACDLSAACQAGKLSCGGDAGVSCVSTGPLSAGTSCGTNRVCTAGGVCAACTAGATCSDNPGAPCKAGVFSCSTGTQRCIDTTPNAPVGTMCGSSQVCDGAGRCVMCTGGQACNNNLNKCKVGTTSCATGASTCIDTGVNTADGTPCGTNQVCQAGTCNACVAGSVCSPGNPCIAGTTVCTTGAAVCSATGNVAAGAPCGTDQVCNGAGACVACAAGVACAPKNRCTNGVTSCATGVSTCVFASNKPSGADCGSTLCGVNCSQISSTASVCNGSGACFSGAPKACACGTAGTCCDLGVCSDGMACP